MLSLRMHTHTRVTDLLVMVHSALAALPRSMSTSSSKESVSNMLLGLRGGTAEVGYRGAEGKREREG